VALGLLAPGGLEPGGGDARAATPQVTLEPVVSGLTNPTLVTNAGDGTGRLFIAEQAGVIKVLEPGTTTPTVFLDIRSRVLTGAQQGLAGLAFHPQYAANRRFFIDYTRQSDAATVIAELQASATDPGVADPAERILLVIQEPLPNLTGGTLAFGPDGFLYVGVGQAGVANDPTGTAQDLDQLLGKILRIDVDQPSDGEPYASPPDNPFVGATPGRDEIFAYGLRNPWRFSFDRATGHLLAGDVGNRAREEVNQIVRGGNYGWPVREGTACSGYVPDLCDAPGFIEPLAEYPHADGRCAVIGGHVYRGARGTLSPGSYVFGDFCSGEILLLEGGVVHVLFDTSLVITSFGQDEAGEIYVADWLGTVYRIAPVAPPISLRLVQNRHTVAPGEELRMDLVAGNLGGAGPQDLYFAILVPAHLSVEFGCPAGDALIFLADGFTSVPLICAITASPRTYAPLYTGVAFPSSFPVARTADFFVMTWPAGLHAGTYTFVAFTAVPAAFADASIEAGDITGFATATLEALP
jgi:glucose/arabinose dehydrogenase